MTTLASRLVVVAVALVGVVPVAAADPPPSIDKLIELLGSPSFPTRERATKALRERGPEALPALRKAMESKDEEVRKRAEGLIPPLEIEEALLPKRVTIKAERRSIDEVLKDFEKQTGYVIRGLGTPSVTTDVKDLPFWEAVERVAQATGRVVEFEPYEQKQMVHLRAAPGRSRHVSIHGPFRLEAQWFHEDRDVDLRQAKPGNDGERTRQLTLSVSIMAEPRITFLKVSPARVEQATDSDGNPLIAPADTKTVQPPSRGTFRGESLIWSDVRLTRVSDSAKTAKVIRGTIPVKCILIRRPVVVSARITESAGTTFRAGSESLVITGVQNQGGNNIEVSIRVPYDQTQPQREWHERFHVEDDAGNKYQMNGRGTSSNGREYNISMYFSAPFNNKKVGPPTKLVFEDWVLHDHAIPFEFREVPLP